MVAFTVKGGKGGKAPVSTAKGQVKRDFSDANPAAAKRVKGSGAAPKSVGEVRFDDPDSAQAALSLEGSDLGGSAISVAIDERSKDMTKIVVTNLLDRVAWQDLKDHFAQCGTVVFADVKSGTPRSAELRMETPEEAQQAIAMLNGATVGEGIITVKAHPTSKDGTKLTVSGVAPGIAWQDLKDVFGSAGTVVFCDVLNDKLPAGAVLEGEVRYDDPAHTQQALTSLNGSYIGDTRIFLQLDNKSVDGSKLIVTGLTPLIEWQELKDHFGQIGIVAFAQIHNKGFAKGKGMAKGFPSMQAYPSMKGAPSMKGFGGFGGAVFPGKGGQFWGKATGGGKSGEVRFDSPMDAQMAVTMLNGSSLKGGFIQVDWDPSSSDGTKLCVSGIAPGTGWQELKDHFASVGRVAFADIKGAKGAKFAKGGP